MRLYRPQCFQPPVQGADRLYPAPIPQGNPDTLRKATARSSAKIAFALINMRQARYNARLEVADKTPAVLLRLLAVRLVLPASARLVRLAFVCSEIARLR